MRPETAFVIRFAPKLIVPDEPDACWDWAGSKDKHGYGRIQRGGTHGGIVKAHRASYELFIGPIPDGMDVLHECDTPSCANPRHLKAGSHSDNMRDMALRNRSAMRGRYGVKHPRHKHPQEIRDLVVGMAKDGKGSRAISTATGIGRSTIRYMLAREHSLALE